MLSSHREISGGRIAAPSSLLMGVAMGLYLNAPSCYTFKLDRFSPMRYTFKPFGLAIAAIPFNTALV